MKHLDGGLQLSIAQHSEAGRKQINEDSLGVRVPEGLALTTKGAVAVIADGVSAAEAGKEAAESCVTGFLNDYFSTPDAWSVKRSAQQVLNALNRWLFAQGQGFAQAEKGYVSTLSIAVLKSRTAHLFHVGDSRIYRLRQGVLEPLTRDHARRINRHHTYLTRAMGLDASLDVDYRAAEIQQGDIFLLTTDGIHDVLDSAQLTALIEADTAELDGVCQALVAAALAAGSTDNVSCQLLRVDRLPQPEAEDVYRKLTELPFPPPFNDGDVVDGLVIEAEIHASPRSQVYRVYDATAGKHYVMKTPSPNFNDDPAYIERFVLEGWIGSRIQSEHVVAVVPTPRQPSYLYYLTEWVDGPTLGEWMRNHPSPPLSDALAIISGVAAGIQAMHRRDTLHQDIKPDNILIRDDSVPVIIDFGSCHVASLAEIAAPIARDRVLGTAQYSAPEHVLGRKPGPAADQFSLAVILFEWLGWKPPYGGKLESSQSLAAYSRLKYISLCQYNPHVPIWVDGALKKALSIHPESRYGDVAEFLYDLQHPNPRFSTAHYQPLVERNPLLFWQALSAALFVLLILSLLGCSGR